MEKLESFRDFLVSGIEFTLGSSDSNSRTGKEDAEYRSGRRLQELKDVLASVETVLRRLKTGLKDDTQIFSTDAEDYLPDDGTGR